MFYAYKATGAVVHEMTLPGGTCGSPMTYRSTEAVHSGVGGVANDNGGNRRAFAAVASW